MVSWKPLSFIDRLSSLEKDFIKQDLTQIISDSSKSDYVAGLGHFTSQGYNAHLSEGVYTLLIINNLEKESFQESYDHKQVIKDNHGITEIEPGEFIDEDE